MKMKLMEIARALGATFDENAWTDRTITSVAFDSRQLQPGGLFIPLVGDNDGHDYVASAKEHGAAATLWAQGHAGMPTDLPVILVADPLTAMQTLATYYLRKINPRVVAITGSNGKTTTKDMVAAILATQFNVTKTNANFNNEIGVPMTVLSMEPNTEMLVVEMGMDRPMQLDFLSHMVNPDVAVITMIGEAHIEFFGTRDRIADAKMEITHGLNEDGVFIYDGDEPLLRTRAAELSQRQVTFGRQDQDDLRAVTIVSQHDQTTFTTNVWPEITFTIPLLGEYNVTNALAALSVAQVFRIRPENVQRALQNVDLTANRTEWLVGTAGEAILSDVYNSNPTAVKEVLAAFCQVPVKHQRMAVLGDMLELGQNADAMHADLATSLLPDKIQQVFLIGPHMAALAQRLAPIYPADQVHYYATDEMPQLIAALQARLTADDAVVMKASHGLHLEQVLAALTDPQQGD